MKKLRLRPSLGPVCPGAHTCQEALPAPTGHHCPPWGGPARAESLGGAAHGGPRTGPPLPSPEAWVSPTRPWHGDMPPVAGARGPLRPAHSPPTPACLLACGLCSPLGARPPAWPGQAGARALPAPPASSFHTSHTYCALAPGWGPHVAGENPISGWKDECQERILTSEQGGRGLGHRHGRAGFRKRHGRCAGQGPPHRENVTESRTLGPSS